MQWWLASIAGAAALIVGAVLIGVEDGRLSARALVLVVIAVLVSAFVLRHATLRWRKSQLSELAVGYTTATYILGGFWLAGTRVPSTHGKVGWDWSGTWVLRPDGSVASQPDRSVDPPGLYPSPHVDGGFELWTGEMWTGFYADPDKYRVAEPGSVT